MELRVHELGIVFYIIDDAKKAATDNGLTSVRRVTLQLGEAVTRCEACGTDYGTVEHGRICPACGSDQTYLLRGREVMIKQIEAY